MTEGVAKRVQESAEHAPPEQGETPAVRCEQLNFYYGATQALFDVNLDIPRHRVTAFIGPSGCGKSTLLRSFNRMNDVIGNTTISGRIFVEGEDVYRHGVPLPTLRKNVGMVFQKSNPFPMSIRDNVAFGPRRQGLKNSVALDDIVERALRNADLWKEVKDRLNVSAIDLSGGQQQRLCIARALANEPKIILMDEPASALDPISTTKIEDTIQELKENYTIVIVTHNMQQAARCSDYTGFLYMGQLIEMDDTATIFQNPSQKQTEDYISGRFG